MILNKCKICGNPAEIRPCVLGGYIAGCWDEVHTEDVGSGFYEIVPHCGMNCEDKTRAVESWNEWNDEFATNKRK